MNYFQTTSIELTFGGVPNRFQQKTSTSEDEGSDDEEYDDEEDEEEDEVLFSYHPFLFIQDIIISIAI